MADTVTPKLGLTKPEVSASRNNWGGKLNADLDIIDNLAQGTDLSALDARVGATETKNTTQDSRMTTIEGVNTSQDTTIALKANIASPIFTGDPKAPTPTAGDNDTSLATTAFVVTAIGNRPTDAPSDTNAYGRKAGTWVDVAEESPADGITYGRKNGAWVASIGGATVSDTPPTPPLVQGQLFFESDTGITYIWFDDGNTTQWVQIAGPQASQQVDYVKKSGDTMTGPLAINDTLTCGAVSSTGAMAVQGSITSNGNFATSIASALLATGTTGTIYLRPNGAGSSVGQTTVDSAGNLSIGGTFTPGGGGGGRIIAAVDTNSLMLSGGAVANTGANIELYGPTASGLQSQAYYDAATHNWRNAAGTVTAATLDGSGFLSAYGNLKAGTSGTGGFQCKAGPGGHSGNFFNLFYNAGPCQLWIDATNLGNISVTSDYRIKKDVEPLTSMWDRVKALRPISYMQAEFTPPAQEAANAERVANGEEAPGPMYPADDVERWGFIAHELQETLLPTAAAGLKDAPDQVQSPNWPPIVAALTKALQEAMARIEALEAARV